METVEGLVVSGVGRKQGKQCEEGLGGSDTALADAVMGDACHACVKAHIPRKAWSLDADDVLVRVRGYTPVPAGGGGKLRVGESKHMG